MALKEKVSMMLDTRMEVPWDPMIETNNANALSYQGQSFQQENGFSFLIWRDEAEKSNGNVATFYFMRYLENHQYI